ncbi:hypothetical protein ACEU2D_25205 [Brevibacillus laterosporus]|uniref:zinc-ribbon domain-containing protein n=1 Tax=Brevibacillus laterosporus TaxID=1465 RepID=UPI0035A5CF4B
MPQRKTIQDMYALAEARGGKCLSTEYINVRVPLKWQCANGHVWETNPVNIMNGNWCSVCSNRKRLTIEDMHELAESRGGKCLSTVYVDSKTKLKWQCQKGHIWEAVPAHIRNTGSWCPVCAIDKLGDARRLSIEEMKELAESKGGKCLSDSYKNVNTLMTWQCEKGHIWKATAASIRSGFWCHHCSGRYRHTIEDVKEYARSKRWLMFIGNI